jgi:hypothetical protein
MSSTTDQQHVQLQNVLSHQNVQLQTQLDAQMQVNASQIEMIALYKKNETRADTAAVHQHNVYNDKKSDADYWKTEWTESEKKVKNLESQLAVAAAMHKYSSPDKDYLVKYIVWSAERNDIFVDKNHPLNNLAKGEKATAWAKLDTQTIKIIIDELASNARFTLNIFDKWMPKWKARDAAQKARIAAQKASMKRGLPVSAHSSPDPKKPKADEEDFGDSSM